jgi:outer membrane protein assembly factor BamB
LLGDIGLRRWVAAIVIAVCVLGSPGAQALWGQVGGDASQSGFVDAGPARNETAFGMQLPGPRPIRAGPLLIDHAAYVLVSPARGSSDSAILRVDLDTASNSTFATLHEHPFSLAANGNTLFLVHDNGVDAYNLSTAVRIWRQPLAQTSVPALARRGIDCAEPLVRDSKLYVACTYKRDGDPNSPTPDAGESLLWVERLDVGDGHQEWLWTKNAVHELMDPSTKAGITSPSGPDASATTTFVVGLTVSQRHVFVVSQDEQGRGGLVQAYVWALHENTGALHWSRSSQYDAPADIVQRKAAWNFAIPTARDGVVYLKFQDLAAVSEVGNSVVWRDDVRRNDAVKSDHGSGFALDETQLFVATRDTITAYDRSTGRVNWYVQPLATNQEWHTGGLVIANHLLYARAAELKLGTTDTKTSTQNEEIYVFDLRAAKPVAPAQVHAFHLATPFADDTGQVAGFRFAVSGGLLVVQGIDGSFAVLGRTAASIQPLLKPSDLTPRHQQSVRIDLSGTTPGLLAPDLQFRADWGDGTLTPWQPEPRFSHPYAKKGNYSASFSVRNAVGQLSVADVVFHVDQVENGPSIIERVFAPDNQNTTFFVLGVLGTSGVSLFGFTRFHRRRTLLGREMKSIEEAYLLTNHIPLECEAALSERKTHARGMLLDGRLSEPQYQVLDARIDELRGQVRVNSLEEKFDFMPVGMMNQLQRILADGHISKGEYEMFTAQLAKTRGLTAEQKGKVKTLVDRWFARDTTETWVEPLER